MSKKRVASSSETSVSEKVPRFAGWIFFFGAVIEFIIVFFKPALFDQITLSLVIFFAINAGACYAFAVMIEKNPAEKSAIFKDWWISLLIINIVIIGSISAYINVG